MAAGGYTIKYKKQNKTKDISYVSNQYSFLTEN